MITADLIRAKFVYDHLTGVFTCNGLVVGTINKRPHSDYACLSIKVNGRYRKVYAHRAAWMYMHGDIQPDLIIDHKDGNGLNNRLDNLKLINKSANQQNRKNILIKRSLPPGIYKQSNGFTVQFLGKHIKWTKDFFEAICIRKSVELRNCF